MDVLRAIGKSDLFRGVDARGLALVAGACQRRAVEVGAHVFRQDDAATHLYVVESGRIALEMMLERPDGSVTHVTTVASMGPGETFGWSALVLQSQEFTQSARAVAQSEVVAIEGAALRAVLDADRELGYVVMANAARLLLERLMQTRETFVYEHDWLYDRPRGGPPGDGSPA